MKLAAKKAVELGKPWVLDPVGCGATPYRTQVQWKACKESLAFVGGRNRCGWVLDRWAAAPRPTASRWGAIAVD